MNAVVESLALVRSVADMPLPAPKPLPPELLPVDPFPMGALPEAFRGWVSDVAERMHCPPDFVAVPMLVGAASLVARHVKVRPQRNTPWTESGNLWALVVGRPGVMKSPALSLALAPMARLEARAAEAFKAQAPQHAAEKLAREIRVGEGIKEAKRAMKKDLDADVVELLTQPDGDEDAVRPRYVVNDLTYEKLGEILSQNPNGVLSVRDEMRALFLHLAREESAPARGFYLQAWSGSDYTFDRIGRGTVTIKDARLSMVGGIQPGPLCDLIQRARQGAGDDGMYERFLIAWPDSPGDWREVDRWPDSESKLRAWETFDYLDSLTPEMLGAEQEEDVHGDPQGMPFLRFSEDAREAFLEWRTGLEDTLRSNEGEGLEGALSKFRHHVPALALALHVIDRGTGAISLASTVRALALAEYFESHARRLHSSGHRTTIRAANAILAKAREKALPDVFSAREVYRSQWSGLSDKNVVGEALDMLVVHGWLNETALQTGGRPTTIFTLAQEVHGG